ncbi:MafI family immunity protein [Pseudomonas sp. M47T1]|uniref:MafI family immunity protein n=1 Tax=Pseudomonas sp. M47T1 TaxID=1179778 RepID=UPI0012FA0A86|nr:MafI family immunity protein [Pseudomonas sp. M47T1]
MYDKIVLTFGRKFEGRLLPEILEGAMNYVGHGEARLAFEILCDHIAEHDVVITLAEYNEAIILAEEMGSNFEELPFVYIRKNLVVD